MACGKLDHLKNGPIYWVDSADTNPCMGEVIAWTISCIYSTKRKHFWLNAVHSAFPSFHHYFSTPPPFPSSSHSYRFIGDVEDTCQRPSFPLRPAPQGDQLHWASQWGHGIHTTEVLWRFPSSKSVNMLCTSATATSLYATLSHVSVFMFMALVCLYSGWFVVKVKVYLASDNLSVFW